MQFVKKLDNFYHSL